jgi:predicted Rossmann fold nucleotide-binding protein DprA/Smf involved in DNA uptake
MWPCVAGHAATKRLSNYSRTYAMKVGIVGSRNWNDYEAFKSYCNSYQKIFPFDMIISGGANGVDAMAYRYAIENGITFVCHPPKPEDGYPRKFFRRNLRIVGQSEIVIAFPMGTSSGTRHSISLCEKLNKMVLVIEI